MDGPSNYPDGLTRAVIDALVAEVDAIVRPVRRVPPLFTDRDAALRRERRRAHRALARVTRSLPLLVPVVADSEQAADGRRRAARRHHRPGGGGMTPIDVHDTRPGGQCLPAIRRAGAPESLTEAIKEIRMLQVHTCVSVHCDQCGDSLGGPGLPAHYPTEDAALDTAAAQGWRVGPGGRLWCSACGPVLTCAAEGHEFTKWRPLLIDECPQLPTRLGHAAATGDGYPVSREYRYCRRCCRHESRRDWVLINGLRGHGKDESAALLLASAEVSGEVA